MSVANALSERMEVEVARGGQLYRQVYERGKPKSGLEKLGKVANRRGTKVRFKPDPQIFGAKAQFNPLRLFKMARAKAYLFGGVEIRWSCAPELLHGVDDVPAEATFHFAEGLKDYLAATIEGQTLVHPDIFAGKSEKPGGHGTVEWAIGFVADADGFLSSYCNTIPTADGGTHESGLRSALTKGLKDHAERTGPGQARGLGHQRRRDDGRRPACSRCSSASRNSRARPRTASPPPKPPASSSRRSRTRSTTGSPAIRRRPTSCSTS